MLRHLVNKLKILFSRNKVINFEMNLKFDTKSNKNTKKNLQKPFIKPLEIPLLLNQIFYKISATSLQYYYQ